MNREDLIKEWIAGRLSTEDLDKEIKDDLELANLKKVISKSSELDVPKKRTKQEAWQLLSSRIETKEQTKSVSLNPYVLLSIAASVTLIVVASYFIFTLPETVNAPKGQHISRILPDGSQVWLNADSEISYRNFTAQEDRTVNLIGEAYFDVKSGGSFEVKGPNGTVRVLGTSFNVNQRDDALEVSCFRGSVEVKSNNGQSRRLKAGQVTHNQNGKLTMPAKFNADKGASWLTGDFYFESIPLEKVLAELERQFNVEIIYVDKEPRTYTGYFNNSDLDEALQLIFEPMSLTYKKEGNKIYVQ
jgi:transmembrane sensor